MKKRQSMGITRAAAVAAFVAGLGGVAHASILSAGGFPGATVNTGFAQCVLTNTGTRDVTVKSATLLDDAGTAKVQESGWIVSPGQTRVFAYVPMSNRARRGPIGSRVELPEAIRRVVSRSWCTRSSLSRLCASR